MKEFNEKIIILIAIVLLSFGVVFYYFFPTKKSIAASLPSTVKSYVSIETNKAVASNADWPEAEEQSEGEMFDLFTPPEIFIDENGDFLFRPPYAVIPTGPFGIRLLEIRLDPYRFQLEGFVEEDRNDQSQTTILLHSVKDGKLLRLNPTSHLPKYGLEILDWHVDRNFNNDGNTEVIARLKLDDRLTNRIINLRHDENLYEDNIEIVFLAEKTGEIFVLQGADSSFFVDDVEYRLDLIDIENSSVLMSKLIPDSEPIIENLPIYNPDVVAVDEIIQKETDQQDASSIEEAFNSFF